MASESKVSTVNSTSLSMVPIKSTAMVIVVSDEAITLTNGNWTVISALTI